jgi:DNA-binding transcriptional LysR family regulator
VRKLRAAPRGRLRINTSNAFGMQQLVPALPDFLERYSEIEVELSFADRAMDLITEHADVAIRAGQINEMKIAPFHWPVHPNCDICIARIVIRSPRRREPKMIRGVGGRAPSRS